MDRRENGSAGFGLVEVVVSMLLLGVIAVAILPALVQGVRFTAEQSSTATATRHLNAVVEQAREGIPTCSSLAALVASPPSIQDGKGSALTVSATLQTTGGTPVTTSTCTGATPPSQETLELGLTLSDPSGQQLAATTALIFIQ